MVEASSSYILSRFAEVIAAVEEERFNIFSSSGNQRPFGDVCLQIRMENFREDVINMPSYHVF